MEPTIIIDKGVVIDPTYCKAVFIGIGIEIENTSINIPNTVAIIPGCFNIPFKFLTSLSPVYIMIPADNINILKGMPKIEA